MFVLSILRMDNTSENKSTKYKERFWQAAGIGKKFRNSFRKRLEKVCLSVESHIER